MKKAKLSLLMFCILLSILSCKITELEEHDMGYENKVTVGAIQEDYNLDDSIHESIFPQEEKQVEFKFLYDEEYWNKYDLTYALFQSKEEYERAILSYIDEISKAYHKDEWYQQYTENKDTIYIRLTIEDSPYEGRSIPLKDYSLNCLVMRLIFTDAMFTQNKAPIVHELTHTITTNKDKNRSSFSLSLTEGICEYANNIIGTNALVNHMIDVHTYYNFYMRKCLEYEIFTQEEIDNIIAMIGEECIEYPEGFVGQIGGAWILSSFSFVDYLIETYGMDAMMAIFNAENKEVYYDYNVDGLTGLRLEWQKFLEDYEPVMSDEDIEKSLLNEMNKAQ